jgi:hypothetical protein
MNAASLATQTTENIADQIQHELLSWDGVTVEPHRFGLSSGLNYTRLAKGRVAAPKETAN